MGSSNKKTGICSAVGCNNSAKKGFTMKPFPKDAVRKQQWLMKMKRPRWKPAEGSVLCEVHFEPGMWEKTSGKKTLKKDAVPTIFSFQRNKRKRKYRDSDSSEDISEESCSDSSDPSYVASDSEVEEASEDEAPRTRTRSGNKKQKTTVKKIEEKKEENQKPASPPQAPTKPVPEPNEKVYNPFSQIKQPANTHPVHPDVRFSRLPFFDILSELLKPSMLKPQNLNVNEENFQFYLTPSQTRDIMSSRIVKQDGLCEFGKQVQLRFCLAETICEQNDYFPKGLMVQINRRLFPLPNPIPTNKPDQEPKRPSRPLNITPLIKLSPITPNTITVIWTSDPGPGYVVSVGLVKKLSSQDLLDRLKKKGVMHSDHTRGLIKEKLNEEDSEIMTTHLRVSLMCPLGKMRMKYPCRPATCKHLQCFDAHIFLQMNERKPTWNCPVCDKPAIYDTLVIDGYFQDVLNSSILPSNINEIELNKDGSWNVQNPIKEIHKLPIDDSIEIIGDDGDDGTAAPTSTTKDTVDIVISDSDDEESTTTTTTTKTTTKTTTNNNNNNKRPASVINLDSSPSSEDGDDATILDPVSGNLIPNPKLIKNKNTTLDSTSSISSAPISNDSNFSSTTNESLLNDVNITDIQQQQQSQLTTEHLFDNQSNIVNQQQSSNIVMENFVNFTCNDFVEKTTTCNITDITTQLNNNPPQLEGPYSGININNSDSLMLTSINESSSSSSYFQLPNDIIDDNSENIVTTTSDKDEILKNNDKSSTIITKYDSIVDSSNLNM